MVRTNQAVQDGPSGSSGALTGKAGTSTRWIIGPSADLALLIGTPLLIVPLFWLAQLKWQSLEVAAIMIALGGVGHHVPGMMRAYGDRALFSRFRWRFILAPLFLIAVCAWAAAQELHVMNLIVLGWGLWHTLAQTYGFARIYDAKVGSTDSVTSQLDRQLCIAWFVGAILFSPARLTDILSVFYLCGGPLLPVKLIHGSQLAWGALMGAITLVYVVHWIRCWRTGRQQNPVKLLLLASSIAFWWFCMRTFSMIIVGVALFEVFHDSQYLTVVWIFNRSRAEKDPQSGSFLRFLFRRNVVFIGIYVVLVLVYGMAVGYYGWSFLPDSIRRIILGTLLASTLLHYYFDGFIWRVRESETRQSLGVSSDMMQNAIRAKVSPKRIPQSMRHALMWTLFIVPVALFGFMELRGYASNRLDLFRNLVEAFPEGPRALNELGQEFLRQGQTQEALSLFERALTADAGFTPAMLGRGQALLKSGKLESAQNQFRQAMEMDPRNIAPRIGMGEVLLQQGRYPMALEEFRAVASSDPNSVAAQNGMGKALQGMGKFDEALNYFERVVQLTPDSALAFNNLGNALQTLKRNDEAITRYQQALQLNPKLAVAHYNLGNASVGLNRPLEAINEYEMALRLDARSADTHEQLATTLQRLGRNDEAVMHFEDAIRLNPRAAKAHNNLGALLAGSGRLQEAVNHFRSALDIQPDYASARENLRRAEQQLDGAR